MPHKLRDELAPGRNVGRALVGFRDCEDTVLNDRVTAASKTCWNVPHGDHPQAPQRAVLGNPANRL